MIMRINRWQEALRGATELLGSPGWYRSAVAELFDLAAETPLTDVPPELHGGRLDAMIRDMDPVSLRTAGDIAADLGEASEERGWFAEAAGLDLLSNRCHRASRTSWEERRQPPGVVVAAIGPLGAGVGYQSP